jgi:hypothetical protein
LKTWQLAGLSAKTQEVYLQAVTALVIGVVGAFDKAVDGPPVMAISDAACREGERKAGKRQTLQSEFQPTFRRDGGRDPLDCDGIHHGPARIPLFN